MKNQTIPVGDARNLKLSVGSL